MKERKFRLHSMPSAQCHVVITRNYAQHEIEIELVSYNTSVCKILLMTDCEQALLSASGTYSVTTSRHINRFTSEFCGKNLYYVVKGALNGHNGYRPVCTVDYDTALVTSCNYWDDSFGIGAVKEYRGHY